MKKEKEIQKDIKKSDEKIGKKSVFYTKALISKDNVKVIMSKEVEDRDGEILSISGCNITNYKKNPIVLWGHRMMSGDVDDVMGRMINIEKTVDDDGIPILQGEVEFADHPKAQYLKRMVKRGMVSTVSVGFGIKDYDAENSTITKWELYEVSFVNVPANTEAVVTEKSIKEADEEFKADMYKKLENYERIHPMIKEYRKLFLKDDELLEALGVVKSGSELVDVKTIHEALKDLICKMKEEEEPITDADPDVENLQSDEERVEDPQAEPATKSDLYEIFEKLFEQK